jgi:alkylhydroperoxidase/carboxymuconolactone decarboxylase family protein YurZ
MKATVSPAFQAFLQHAPGESKAWMDMVEKLAASPTLDAKTRSLCYLSVLAAMRLSSGVPFHAAHARSLGATRDEVIGAILVGLPAAGNTVIEALPLALTVFEHTASSPEP